MPCAPGIIVRGEPCRAPAHPCGAADARGRNRQNTARTLNRVALLTLGRAERGMLCLRLSPSRLVAKSQVLGGFRRPRRLRRIILGDPAYTSAAKAATAPPCSQARVGVHRFAISAAKAAMFTPSFTHACRCALAQISAAKAASPPVPTLAPFGVPRTYTSAAKAATKVRAQGPDAKRGAAASRFEPRRVLACRALEISQALGLCSMAT